MGLGVPRTTIFSYCQFATIRIEDSQPVVRKIQLYFNRTRHPVFGSQANMINHRIRPAQMERRAFATSECVIVLPIIFMIMFTTIELCSVIFVKEALTVAAYEAGRVAVQRRTTLDQAISAGEAVLESRNVATGSNAIQISPNPTTAIIMQPITVTATAPVSGNTVIPSMVYKVFGHPNISTQVVMRKEFMD